MLIKDIMTKNPVTILPDASLTEAKALMTKKDISKLPVLDKSNRLVGIITKNDLQKAAPSSATSLDIFEIGYLLSKLTVSKIMVKNPVTVDENDTVETAARLMADKKIGCVPVLADSVLVGIVTESDLFSLFIDMFAAKSEGVSVTYIATDKPGQLAAFSQKIADDGGNILSVVTRDVDADGREVTLKAANLTLEQMKQIAADCGVEVEDLRQMK